MPQEMRSVSGNMKATRVMTAQAAGSTNVNGSVIDMQGMDGVAFVMQFGTLTATTVAGLKVQQGDIANLSDAADLLGSQQLIADDEDDQVLIADVYRPLKRYLRVVAIRGTANAVIDGCMAFQFGAAVLPVTQDATTIAGSEILISPIEGTA